jgi:hypothetical protein
MRGAWQDSQLWGSSRNQYAVKESEGTVSEGVNVVRTEIEARDITDFANPVVLGTHPAGTPQGS